MTTAKQTLLANIVATFPTGFGLLSTKQGANMTTSWWKQISIALEANGDNWKNLESCTLTDSELHAEFDAGYGGTEGKPFTMWTKTHVYFPACYDGSEWCASVSRNPDYFHTAHIGGG